MTYYVSLIVVDCGNPGVLIDGQETYFGTSYRQVATFICNDDFTMVGDGARRCEANGEWTGEIPTCVGKYSTCIIHNSSVINQDNNNNIIVLHTCGYIHISS